MLRRGIAVVTAVVIWQLVASLVGSVILPTPLDCLVAAQQGVMDGSLGSNALASLTRVAIGYVMAAVAGVLLGALSGLTSSAGLALRDILELLRPIPPIAWVPIAILWFGLGDSSAWFVVFVGAFFPIFIQVSHAFSTCDRDLWCLSTSGYEAHRTWLTYCFRASAVSIFSRSCWAS